MKVDNYKNRRTEANANTVVVIGRHVFGVHSIVVTTLLWNSTETILLVINVIIVGT